MGKWTVAGSFYRDNRCVSSIELLRILNAHEGMLEALEEIAESPHRYFEDKHGTYVLGVADGHRFCAEIAKDAIAAGEGTPDDQE